MRRSRNRRSAAATASNRSLIPWLRFFVAYESDRAAPGVDSPAPTDSRHDATATGAHRPLEMEKGDIHLRFRRSSDCLRAFGSRGGFWIPRERMPANTPNLFILCAGTGR